MKNKFIELYPCIYEGKTLCLDCRLFKTCGMKEGRENQQELFESGYREGLLFAALLMDKIDKCVPPPDCWEENRQCHFCAQEQLRRIAEKL